MTCRFLLLAAVGLLAGCQQAGAPASARGRSTVAFIDPPAPGGRKPTVNLATESEPLVVLDAARPVEPLAQPVYPRAALAANAGPMLVGVRISVDADGRVSDVGPSPVSFSTPGPFAAEFRAAAEAAVWQWKFVPAKRRYLEPVPVRDGGSYWRATNEEKADSVFDVAITFSAGGAAMAAAEK